MTAGDPELAAVLAAVTLRPARRVAAAIVDVGARDRTRAAVNARGADTERVAAAIARAFLS